MNRWQLIGRICGYPECCIQDFLNRNFTAAEPRKLRGTGYVPCPECNKLSVDELIANINARRHPDAPPFPDYDMRKTREIYMNHPDWAAILEEEARS